MPINCCSGCVHLLRLAHQKISQRPDELRGANAKPFRPDVARRIWAQMVYQYLRNVENILPTVRKHFSRGGANRFAAAIPEPCCVGYVEQASYHQIAIELAERMLTIVTSAVLCTPMAHSGSGIGQLEPIFVQGAPPSAEAEQAMSHGFHEEKSEAIVEAITINCDAIQRAFEDDRIFSEFSAAHWNRLFTMTQKEAALVPEAHANDAPETDSNPAEASHAIVDESVSVPLQSSELRRQPTAFISYSRKDKDYYDDLMVHLSVLMERGLYVWGDPRIDPGQEWSPEIERNLEAADIILLLVSADYFHSGPCKQEMKRAFERHRSGAAVVVPILIRECQWKDTEIGSLQTLPRDGKCICSLSDRDGGWLSVADGVKRAVENIGSRPRK